MSQENEFAVELARRRDEMIAEFLRKCQCTVEVERVFAIELLNDANYCELCEKYCSSVFLYASFNDCESCWFCDVSGLQEALSFVVDNKECAFYLLPQPLDIVMLYAFTCFDDIISLQNSAEYKKLAEYLQKKSNKG